MANEDARQVLVTFFFAGRELYKIALSNPPISGDYVDIEGTIYEVDSRTHKFKRGMLFSDSTVEIDLKTVELD